MDEGEIEPRPRFTEQRDAVLYRMVIDGWSNESSGDVRSPQGRFARITNEACDLPEVTDAFEEEIVAEGLTDATELVGHFLLHDYPDQVVVRSYSDARSLERDYHLLEDDYAEWVRSDRYDLDMEERHGE